MSMTSRFRAAISLLAIRETRVSEAISLVLCLNFWGVIVVEVNLDS